MDCPKGHRPPLTSETLQSKGDAGGRGPQEAPNEPQGASTFRPEFYSQKWGWGQVGWVAGAQVTLRVGSGGLKYHLDSGGRRLRTPTGERMQPLGPARCSHTSWRGQCGGGTLAPARGKMRQLQGQPPGRQQSPGRWRNQSSPLWCQGRLLGHGDCTLGTWPRLRRHPIPALAGIFRAAPTPGTQGRRMKMPHLEGI